jgi:tetratricopeptide (TPR) repeat protein
VNSLEKNLTEEKIKLIYEFNSSSPLFARVASNIIDQGNIFEAVSILENGLSNYPDYPSAIFILALAHAYSGNEKEARSLVRKGAGIIQSDSVLDFYMDKISSIIKERNSLPITKKIDFDEPVGEEPKLEDQLEVLAQKLTGAKINYKADEDSPVKTEIEEFKGEKIVSETLAEIYLSQNKFQDALNVYKELIKKNPDKADDYVLRVAEIQNKIDQESGITLV